MAHKTRDSRGFTLVEMLCATVILVLLGLLVNTGLHMAVKSYQDITAQAELELLLSTLGDALANDLRYAKDVETYEDGRLECYHSENYNGADGQTTALSVHRGADEDDGQVYANDYRLLPGGAYGNGAYEVKKPDGTDGLEIEFDKTTGVFKIKLAVQQKGGGLSAQSEFTVKCLNPN